MYTRYFGLAEKPFSIAPDPKYLFMSDAHREALAHLLYGISGEGCIILLTGDIGIGKTTVCRCLIEQLPADADVAIILNPKLSITDLLQTICEEFGITVEEDSPTVKTYVDLINSHLLQCHAEGRNSALIIDEAQNLDKEILEHLRLLTNLETNTKKLLQIILIGQPELRQILEAEDLKQVNQRITARFHLGPLKTEDISAYIQHRIRVAGGAENSGLFQAKEVAYLAKVSKGIPRVINTLCDRSLLGAYTENRRDVDLPIVKKAAQELGYGPASGGKSGGKLVLLALLCCLLVAVAGLLYFFPSTSVESWLERVVQATKHLFSEGLK